MATRFLILAAGIGYRWHDYLGHPKHFLRLDGETIIERTVRQLAGHDVVIVGADERYALPGAELYVPSPEFRSTGTQVDKFLTSEPVWSTTGRTVWLWGDVWWSDEAIGQVIDGDHGDWQVYLRPTASKLTGCGHGEMFAHQFYPEHHDAERAACARVVRLFEAELIPWLNTGGWAHYRAMLGLPDDQVHGWVDGRHAVTVDDWTDDFDSPLDYRTWYGRRAHERYPIRVLEGDRIVRDDAGARALVVAHAGARVREDQLWCAVAHAVEHRQPVIPYTHRARRLDPWEYQPPWTGRKDADRPVMLVTPVEGAEGPPVRLSGPAAG